MNTAAAIKAIGQILCRKDAKALISTRLGHLPTTTAAVFGLFEGLGEVTLSHATTSGLHITFSGEFETVVDVYPETSSVYLNVGGR